MDQEQGILAVRNSCVIRNVIEDGEVSSIAGTLDQSDHENGRLTQATLWCKSLVQAVGKGLLQTKITMPSVSLTKMERAS